MIEDRNYSEEEVAEDLLDLIKEFEAEIKKLKEREKTLLKLLQTSLGDSPAAQIDEYVRVKIDQSLRLFELDLRTRYADEEAATSKAVDLIFKEYTYVASCVKYHMRIQVYAGRNVNRTPKRLFYI